MSPATILLRVPPPSIKGINSSLGSGDIAAPLKISLPSYTKVVNLVKLSSEPAKKGKSFNFLSIVLTVLSANFFSADLITSVNNSSAFLLCACPALAADSSSCPSTLLLCSVVSLAA